MGSQTVEWMFCQGFLTALHCYFNYHYTVKLISLISFSVPEPGEGKKRKGKTSRPLRIDLILQRDSLVPPPKESVFGFNTILVNRCYHLFVPYLRNLSEENIPFWIFCSNLLIIIVKVAEMWIFWGSKKEYLHVKNVWLIMSRAMDA